MKRFFYLCATLILVGITGCQQRDLSPVEEIRFLMDTVVRISIYDAAQSPEAVAIAVDSAFAAMARVEQAASIHVEESEISALVRAAGRAPVKLSSDVHRLLHESVAIGRATGGAFDCTIGAVKALWPFDEENAVPPSAAAIAAALPLVDDVLIRFTENTAYLPKSGMRVDLGGVAKGLAIDRAVAALRRAGIKAGIVDAGGDLRILGAHPARPQWGVGVRHPRAGLSTLFAALRIDSLAVATSGDYERYFEYEGVQYHHLLNPQTGTPARGAVSVTIKAPTAVLADAYATAVFVMGPEAGMELIEKTAEIEGMILSLDGEDVIPLISSGLKSHIEF